MKRRYESIVVLCNVETLLKIYVGLGYSFFWFRSFPSRSNLRKHARQRSAVEIEFHDRILPTLDGFTPEFARVRHHLFRVHFQVRAHELNLQRPLAKAKRDENDLQSYEISSVFGHDVLSNVARHVFVHASVHAVSQLERRQELVEFRGPIQQEDP